MLCFLSISLSPYYCSAFSAGVSLLPESLLSLSSPLQASNLGDPGAQYFLRCFTKNPWIPSIVTHLMCSSQEAIPIAATLHEVYVYIGSKNLGFV